MDLTLKFCLYILLAVFSCCATIHAQRAALVVQTGHSGPVTSIAFSPDGKTLASGSWDLTIKLWEVASGRELRSLAGHSKKVDSVAFSPDGMTLVSGSYDNTIKLWEVESGRELRTFSGHSNSVSSLAFSPDGKTLASGSADKTIKLWDAVSGAKLREFTGHSSWISSVAFTPDGKTLASGSGDNTIKLWEVASGAVRTLTGHSGYIYSVAFSPDGRMLASGSGDKSIKLWDVASARESQALNGHSDGVYLVAFSPDGKTLASRSGDHTIKLWDVASGAVRRALTVHSKSVSSLGFSPDGKTLASGSDDNTIKLWEVASGRELRMLTGHSGLVYSLAFSPDGKTLASGSDDQTIRLWSVESGREVRTLSGHSNSVSSVAFSPDGTTLASGSYDNTIKLWKAESGREFQTLSGHSKWVDSVAFSPDGKTLASGSYDKTIKLWEVKSGRELRTLNGHSPLCDSVVFSPDGKTLASGSDDNTIKLWEVASGAMLRTFTGHSKEVYSVAFSPDGKTLASGSRDQTIKLWEAESGRELRMLSGHSIWVASVAFSPDGKTLASGSGDKTIKLWEVASGRELRTFSGHSSLADSIAFSPDGKTLVSASSDKTVKLWNIDSGKELGSLIALDQNDWAVIDPEGRFDVSPGGQTLMHFVVGLEPIAFEQLKDRYYEPGLLHKQMGFDKTPLRPLQPFTGDELYPAVEYQPPKPGQKPGHKSLTVKLTNRGGGIGPVQVLVNGKEYIADARPKGFDPKTQETTLSVDLTGASWLTGKDNKVLVLSRNAAGYLTSSRGASLVYAAEGQAETPDPELYAIVGGVSDYTGDQLRLGFASKDAEDIGRALRLGGEKLFGTKKVHLTVLSTSGKPGTVLPIKENFRKAFEAARVARPTDVLVVYLSGHAVAIRLDGDRDLYCYLTKEAQSGEMGDPKVRLTNAISSEELAEWISRIPALKQVMMLDTCSAGAAIEQLNLIARKDISSDQIRALEKLKDRTGFHVLMGSAADKPSYETSQYSQGLLTYALLEGMKFAAVKNEVVEVSDLFQYARTRVPVLARSMGIGGIQTPQIMAPNAESFPLMRMTGAEQEAIKLEQARPLILRPRLFNQDQPADEELELALRRQLRELSEPATRGQPAREQLLVYLPDGELPSAIKPSGTYHVEGQQIKVSISLIRNRQPVGRFEVTWNKEDLRGLVNKISAELIEALKRIDGGGP